MATNTFVGVPQPDSPHKPLSNLVNSARVDACASLFHVSSLDSRQRPWLLARKPRIVPLFGTRSLERFEKNIGAPSVRLTDDDMRNDSRATLPVQGNRYPDEHTRHVGL